MSTIAVYPGTFDPLTNGHVDIIERAAALFDEVIVAVAPTNRKTPYLNLAERISLIEEVLQPTTRVRTLELKGLLIDFVKAHGASVILRGLRAVSDFDYEFQLAHMNHQLDAKVETLFLPAKADFSYISGTIVREIVSLGGDVSAFVPPAVASLLKTKVN